METAPPVIASASTLQVLPSPRPRSSKQVAASRTNGCKSRGPVTRAGKQRSKLNALTHGLFARVVPTPRFPIFYTRDEVALLAGDIALRYDCRDQYTLSLAESAAIDMLRLRQIKRLEHAALEPDVEGRRDIEQAMEQRRGHVLDLTPQDQRLLLDAATAALQTLKEEQRIRIGVGHDLMVTEVWRMLSATDKRVESLREELAEPDDPEDEEWSKQRKARLEKDLAEALTEAKQEGPSAYGVTDVEDVDAILQGSEIPTEFVSSWITLMGRVQTSLLRGIHEIEEAELRIQQLQRELLLPAFKKLEVLGLLGDYEQRVQRQLERTIALLKDSAGGAKVIDLT